MTTDKRPIVQCPICYTRSVRLGKVDQMYSHKVFIRETGWRQCKASGMTVKEAIQAYRQAQPENQETT